MLGAVLKAGKGLKLSLVTKSTKAAAAEGVAPAEGTPAAKPAAAEDEAAAIALGSYQPGDLVYGTVTAVHTREANGETVPAYFELAVAPAAPAPVTPPGTAAGVGAVVGRLEVAHLSDHPAAAAALAATLAPGARLGPLLVLQRLDGVKQLRLTRKASLLAGAAAGLLPSAASEVAEGALIPGYVASVTGDAVFVR